MITKIAGLTHEGRGELAARLKEGQALYLHRDRENKYDPNAVQVLTASGTCMGFLPKELAFFVAQEMDRGERHEVTVQEIRLSKSAQVPVARAVLLELKKKL